MLEDYSGSSRIRRRRGRMGGRSLWIVSRRLLGQTFILGIYKENDSTRAVRNQT